MSFYTASFVRDEIWFEVNDELNHCMWRTLGRGLCLDFCKFPVEAEILDLEDISNIRVSCSGEKNKEILCNLLK
jgi:hypothetical protein